MKYAILIFRLILGIPLLAFGIIGLLQVMPDPRAAWEGAEGFTPEAANFIIQMWESGFLGLTVALGHLIAGFLLVVNRYVPLALAIHLPISIQMSLFHVFLDPGTGLMAWAILILNVFLIYKYRDYFKDLFTMKATPKS